LFGILVAIGCGGAKPQNASATDQTGDRGGTVPAAERSESRSWDEGVSSHAGGSTGGSSTVTGSITFTGTVPAQEKIRMDADPQCALQHKDAVTKQEVVVNPNGTLRNVFVYVKDGLQGKTFPAAGTAATINQQGCMYEPHVLGVQVNQPIEIVNNDQTLHNVNCKPTKSKPFNIAQPIKGMKSSKSFTAPEVMVKCACNVHPWMASYIGVVEHPFFSVSGDDGTFTLAGLPAGQYTIEAWHEKYGAKTQTVSLGDGEKKTVDFEFTPQ